MTTNRERAALGTGWCFPIRVDARGGIAMCSDEEKIAQSIRIILSTAKGERVMRPDFGCDLREFVFASMDRSTLKMVESAVRDALVRWEPRIDVDSVRVSPDGVNPNALAILVCYRIRSTNTEFNLVYPFYADPGS